MMESKRIQVPITNVDNTFGILWYKRIYHVIFWVACFFILFRLFTKDYYNGHIDFIFTGLFIVPMIFVVYANRWLIDYTIYKRSVLQYFLGTVLLIAVSVGLHYVVFDFMADIIFRGYFIVSYLTPWEVAQYSLVFLAVSTLLKFAKDWFIVKDRELALVQENHRVQLSSLKSQINPHFLFNSLNNIYALSTDDPGKVRGYILKLSDALRYMIYDTEEDKVVLQDELSYLSDYIELEKLRMNDPGNVTFKFPENTSELIAPMILLPLVENCFKHVDKHSPVINITVTLEGTIINISACNNFDNSSPKKTGGLGLSNLQKRLQLLYPDSHNFSQRKEDDKYCAILSINLEP